MHKHGAGLLAVAAFLLAGCYHATIDTGLQPSGQVIEQPWAMSFVYGLVPPPVLETAAQCPNGVAKVETVHSFLNGLVGAISAGIVTPMTIKVSCASARSMAEDAAELHLSRSAGLDEQRERLTAALQAAGTGKTIVVHFD